MKTAISRRPILRGRLGAWMLGLAILAVLGGIALGPVGVGIQIHRESAAMQTCRTIALAEFQYANDNGGKYPSGNSSTEVFQKLIDEKYVSDAALFYIPMPGKVRPTSKRLSIENVCYDVTDGVSAKSPLALPLVFATGFRVEYKPDGRAISLVKPFPSYDRHDRGWIFSTGSRQTFEGFAVAYVSNNAWFKESRGVSGVLLDSNGFGVVPDVVSTDFDAHEKQYRQLTPNGSL